MNGDFPPIVLLVGVQGASSGPHSAALEEAGFWIASGRLRDAPQDIIDLRPNIVIADLTARTNTDDEEVHVRALTANSKASAVPLIVLEKATDPEDLLTRVKATLAAPLPVQQRAAPAAVHRAATTEESRVGYDEPKRLRRAPDDSPESRRTCPECGRPLKWVERTAVVGSQYDYYGWCDSGCGLYCFETSTGRSLKLA